MELDKIDKQNSKYALLDMKNEELNDQVIILQNRLDKFEKEIPKETEDIINYYDNKYLSKEIFYAGTEIETKLQGILKPNINVCDYVHITKSMKKWIESKQLIFKEEPTTENISQHQWKIYSEFTKHTKYIYDKDLYGYDEMWLPNFEQMYILDNNKWLGDCENMALLCLGLILSSGIPRGLSRVAAGDTKLGGHACLTCWDWRTKKFEQWETTSSFPIVVDETNPILIKDVWFSFDSEKAWSNLDKSVYEKIK